MCLPNRFAVTVYCRNVCSAFGCVVLVRKMTAIILTIFLNLLMDVACLTQ